jgi:hypothetical protein
VGIQRFKRPRNGWIPACAGMTMVMVVKLKWVASHVN